MLVKTIGTYFEKILLFNKSDMDIYLYCMKYTSQSIVSGKRNLS